MQKGKWICPAEDMGQNCPLFGKVFTCNGDIRQAELKISARGVYEARLNGQRVGEFIMAPGWTCYRKRIQYQVYDVTPQITSQNFITLQLGTGWYAGRVVSHHHGETLPDQAPPAVWAELTLTYDDGRVEQMVTDETWQVAYSGLLRCDIYDGLCFDAGMEPSFTGKAAVSEDSTPLLVPTQGEEVHLHDRFPVQRVFATPKGERIADFGQNVTGFPILQLTAKAGERVRLSFAEVLDKDGNFYNENYRSAKAEFTYLCKDGEQTYQPSLTFYGFRYVRIDEFPADADPALALQAASVHSHMHKDGHLTVSDPLLQRFIHNTEWGQKGNFLDVPTDCPQRDERLGWTGDAQVFCRTAAYQYDVRRFFTKWLTDLTLEQKENGSVPHVIPNVLNHPGGSAGWGDAVTICPWTLYEMYGDPSFLSLTFDSMCRWVDYIRSSSSAPDLWQGGEHFGDWLALDVPYGETRGASRPDLIASAFYANSLQIVCRAGEILGKEIDRYREQYARTVTAFRTAYDGDFKTQTECVLALQFELTAQPEATAALLAEKIRAAGIALETGFLGTPYLLHVLTRYGYGELAYSLLLRKEYPSWLYPVTRDATTVWEHWDGIRPDGTLWPPAMNSYNHYAYGSVVDWLYGTAAGITPQTPGFGKVHFEPLITEQLDTVMAEHRTPHGTVWGGWYRQNGVVTVTLTTPVPATAVFGGQTRELAPGQHEFIL